jgi:hypothetical protein
LLDEQNDSWFFDVVFLGPKFELATWTQPRWDLPHRYRIFQDLTLIGSTARYLHIHPISDYRSLQENIAHMVSSFSPSDYYPEPRGSFPRLSKGHCAWTFSASFIITQVFQK